MLRRWCIPVAGLALGAGALAASAPALASSHPARHISHPASHASHPAGHAIHLIRPGMRSTAPLTVRGRPGHATRSHNWSGYAAHGTAYRKISASWVEPTAHCTGSRAFSSFWVGLDGFSTRTVEQTGTEVDCSGGHARYFGWYEMYPAGSVNFGNRVRPGDHFTGSVTFTGGGHYTLVLKDTTRGWSHTVHKTRRRAKHASAEVIAEAPCCTPRGRVLPLTDFGTVHFSAAVNGAAMGRADPIKIIMVDPSGHAKVSVSALGGRKAYGVRWRRST